MKIEEAEKNLQPAQKSGEETVVFTPYVYKSSLYHIEPLACLVFDASFQEKCVTFSIIFYLREGSCEIITLSKTGTGFSEEPNKFQRSIVCQYVEKKCLDRQKKCHCKIALHFTLC